MTSESSPMRPLAAPSTVDISREALVLEYESKRNTDRIAELSHQIKVVSSSRGAVQQASSEQISSMQKEIQQLNQEVETLQAEEGEPMVGVAKMTAAQNEIAQLERLLTQQQRELDVLVSVLKPHYNDERLRLDELTAQMDQAWAGKFFPYLAASAKQD